MARRVLDAIVQQARAHRRDVELELGDHLRDRERMRDVRIARLAGLAVVRLRGELVRAADQRQIGARMVASDLAQDLIELMHHDCATLTRVPRSCAGARLTEPAG